MDSNYICCDSYFCNFSEISPLKSSIRKKFFVQVFSKSISQLLELGCPTGRSYVYPGTSLPLQCNPNGASCPAPYICQKSTRYPGYQCCSTTMEKTAMSMAEEKSAVAIDFKHKQLHSSDQLSMETFMRPNSISADTHLISSSKTGEHLYLKFQPKTLYFQHKNSYFLLKQKIKN